jgi:hypothetical protein
MMLFFQAPIVDLTTWEAALHPAVRDVVAQVLSLGVSSYHAAQISWSATWRKATDTTRVQFQSMRRRCTRPDPAWWKENGMLRYRGTRRVSGEGWLNYQLLCYPWPRLWRSLKRGRGDW